MNQRHDISVVISTFERPDACERALRSVLEQDAQPLEVLICDNGSSDDTAARLGAWEQRHEQVRYLRTPTNSGTPATTRNLGIEHAQGAWVAFLDDDDTWLSQKLTRQLAVIAAGGADVIATNALRSDGSVYFENAPDASVPRIRDLLLTNPVITSTVLVRRSLAGFPDARWMRGIEDYAAWLSLADAGARFVVLGEALVRYQDTGAERLSAARTARQLAVARLSWGRAARRPLDAQRLAAAMRHTAGALHVAVGDGLSAAGSVLERRG